jgi:hypothetical protein
VDVEKDGALYYFTMDIYFENHQNPKLHNSKQNESYSLEE